MTASFDLTFSNTYYTFLIGYLGIRLITVIQYFVISKQLTGNARKVAILLGSVFSTRCFDNCDFGVFLKDLRVI